METLQLKSSVAELFVDASIDPGGMEVNPLSGGGNNKVVSVQTNNGRYLAKFYYSHPSDTRNRLAAEYSFLSYAFKVGLSCVPKPIFCDNKNNIGLYEFIEGRKLDASELTRQHIIEAARFIKKLNVETDRNKELPIASEGCFSVEQHFSIIDNRLNRLLGMPKESELERQAYSFVGEIENTWKKTKEEISKNIESISEELETDDRCISPSDFGFHNALLKNSGDICFIDFEYAGWDDPAKMVGDFFLQPAVSVSLDHFDSFISEALNYSKNKASLADRARLLFPIFKIKWCCLILNEFLPDAAKRRRFANPTLDTEQSKHLQLQKAQQFFNSRKV
jgi:thiamine kinase-like enzyme